MRKRLAWVDLDLVGDAPARHRHPASQPALKAMREGVLRGLEFTGITPRADFWWFALAVVMLLAFAELLAGVVGPLPWIAACARRLRDAGLSPWCSSSAWRRWGGILVLLYLLTYLTKTEEPIEATPG